MVKGGGVSHGLKLVVYFLDCDEQSLIGRFSMKN